MRLAQSASLLVAFYVLTSAATAYAECAWVLWEITSHPFRQITPRGSWVTHRECIHERESWEELREGTIRFKRSDDDIRAIAAANTEYTCYPDTVDPRGPKKGK